MTYSFMFEDLPMRGQTDIEGGGSKLLFSHPNINGGDPLVIKTGANNVNWGYTLNTKRIPTYGGEVIQVLSMYAESMKVSGQTRNYKEQKYIYDYFRKYLNLAGGMGGTAANDRNQTPITFSYPARGWTFEIFVVELDDMRMALDVVAPEWGFTAEIASENDRYELGGAILTGMANVLTDPAIVNNSGSGVIGYDPANKYSSDTSGLGNEEFMATIDERLQSQIASWATGDFSQYLFNRIAGENADTSFKTQSEYWTNMFGSDIAFTAGGTAAGSGTGSDTSTLSSMSGILEPVYVAAIAAEGFKKAGYTDLANNRDWLIRAVRVASGESGWDTQAICWNYTKTGADDVTPQYNYPYQQYIDQDLNTVPQSSKTTVGNFDLGLWQINNWYHSNTILRANGESPTGDSADRNRVAKNGLAKSMFDPVLNATAMAYTLEGKEGNWGLWIAPLGDENTAKEAVDKYLANPSTYAGAVGAPLSGTITQRINQIAEYLVAHKNNIWYGQGKHRNSSEGTGATFEEAKALIENGNGWWGDCSSTVYSIYKWAGAEPDAVGFSSGGTTAQEPSCTNVTLDQATIGDLVFYDGHVEMIVNKTGSGSTTVITTFSHGGPGTANASDEKLEDSSPSFNTVNSRIVRSDGRQGRLKRYPGKGLT